MIGPTTPPIDTKAWRRHQVAGSVPGVRTISPDDIAKATSPSTQMALTLAATGHRVYEGTVDPAVVAIRRRKNKAARRARRANR